MRHDRLVVYENAKSVFARHVCARDNACDALDRFSSGRINRNDTRMRVRRAKNLNVQHSGHRHVGGIFQPARHLAWSIYTPHIFAYEITAFGFVFHQSGRRQRAILYIARQLNCVEDLLIAGAAADVATQPLLDLLTVGEGVCSKRGGCRHHHAGDAIAALAGARLVKGFLQDAELTGFRQRLDRFDGRPLSLSNRQEAGFHQRAVDEH